MIATLGDVIEQLADEIGIYGSHVEDDQDSRCECRICWTMSLRMRIESAVEIEKRLGIWAPNSDKQLAVETKETA